MPRGQWFLLIERANVPLVQTKDNIPATFTETPGSGPSKRSRASTSVVYQFQLSRGTFASPVLRTIALSRGETVSPGESRPREARSFGRNFYGKFRSLDMFTRHARPRRYRKAKRKKKPARTHREYERALRRARIRDSASGFFLLVWLYFHNFSALTSLSHDFVEY